ncbi:MAG: outer rane efflux protein, partial [Bryobacterales bacterium]|nr:outer rane efflux protein [Bryobacterales bacterium]
MLRITITSDSESAACRLEGKLAGRWVAELEQSWRTELAGSRSLVVDLDDVSFVDAGGKALLARMHAQGAKLVTTAPFTKAIVEEIVGDSRPGSKQLCAAVWVMLLAGFAPAVRGQTPAVPSTLRLTLRDAVQLALRQNPQVQIANLNLAQSQEDRAISRSALLPQTSLSASEREERANLSALTGRPIPGFPQHIGPFAIFQAGLNFSVPIFDLTLWRRWQASKSNVTATAAQEQTAREQIALLVVSQYLAGLRTAADISSA